MATQSLIDGIKALRERTGAGMMDCKKALEENDLDLEKAADWLREKGIAKAAKKADRIAAEGKTFVKTCPTCGKTAILEINCETDFVSKGDAFNKLVDDCATILLEKEPKTLDEAKELCANLFTDATVKMGEKLDFRRFEIIHKEAGKAIGSYIHMGGKITTVVVLDKENEELANNLAMHVAANSPLFVSTNDIPAEVKEKEMGIQIELAKNDPKLGGKPEEMLKKILEAKVNKTLYESVLSEQIYLLNEEGHEKDTVGQVLAKNGVKVVRMIRYGVGEGIEKRKDDFASEVMSQVK